MAAIDAMGSASRPGAPSRPLAWLFVCALLGSWGAPDAAAQRNAFIDELFAFRVALAGTHGDEGPRVVAALEGMALALAQWDRTLAAIEGDMRGALDNAPVDRAMRVHTTLASLYLERGRFEDARAELDAAIAIEARAALYVLRGLVHEKLGAHEEGLSDLARARALDPADPVTAFLVADRQRARGVAADVAPQVEALRAAVDAGRSPDSEPFLRIALLADDRADEPVFVPAAYADGFAHILAGRLDEAMASFRTAVATDPLVVRRADEAAPIAEASAMLRAGRFEAAIDHLASFAASTPEWSEAYRLIGRAQASAGRPAEAIGAFRTAVRLAPDDERPRLALGGLLLRQGQWEDAEDALREAIDRLPSSGEGRWALADLYQPRGRASDAVAQLEAAAALPVLMGRGALYWRIAEIAWEQQDYDRVIAALSARVRADPNSDSRHRALGTAHLRLGAHDEAWPPLLMAAWLAPDDAQALWALGQLHVEAGDYAAAEPVLQRAVVLAPDLADARFALGTALVHLGRREEGEPHLRESQRLRQVELDARRHRFERERLLREADLQSTGGAHADAAALLKRLVALEPEDAEHRLALARALVRAGEAEAAVAHLEAAAEIEASPGVYRELVRLYGQLGRDADRARAVAMLERLERGLP